MKAPGHKRMHENMEQITRRGLRSVPYTGNRKFYLQHSPLEPLLLVKINDMSLCLFFAFLYSVSFNS